MIRCSSFGSKVAAVLFGLLALSLFGEVLLWIFLNAPVVGVEPLGSHLWYIFSLLSGVGAMGLPFALPFVLLIIPIVKREGLAVGGSALLALSAGTILILSFYGAVVASIGVLGMEHLQVKGIHLKDWINIFSGIFIYVLAIGEIGLVRMRLSSYGGPAPMFIQKRDLIGTAFFLGIFLGNIGVASYPAIPLLLIESASSGNALFGALLLAMHALGRILMLVLLVLLAVYGFDSVKWLTEHRERLTHVNGWAMICVASVITTLGVFSHGWWEATRLHEVLMMGSMGQQIPKLVGDPLVVGVFGLPIAWGGWLICILLLVPLWLYYRREWHRVYGTPAMEMKKLQHDIDTLEATRRHLEVIAHIPKGEHGDHILRTEHEIDALETKRRIFEDAVRYGAKSGLRDQVLQKHEEETLRLRRNLYVVLSLLALLAVLTFF